VLTGAALILAAVIIVLAAGGGAGSLQSIAADSVGAIAPGQEDITADVPLGSSPSGVAAGDGAVWIANYNNSIVSRIDPTSHAVQTIQVDSTPSGIAFGAGAVWVANTFSGTVSRINPSVNRVVRTIGVGNGPSGVAVGYGAVWVANSSDGTLSRINAITDATGKPIALGGSPTGVATGFRSVWVSDADYARVLRIDSRTGQLIQPINVGTGPSAIATGFGSVWVANSLDGTVMRINPGTNHVTAAIHVGDTPNALAVGADGVWVANEFGDDVVRIDPATDTPAHTIQVGNRPEGVAILGRRAWVSAQASETRHRGGTMTALQNVPMGSLDPGNPGSAAAIDTLYMTGDGLVGFNHVGSAQGTQVVPDLATSVPAPTDGGRTYTFRLRRGIRFSNGQLVRPEDFRRAIERDLVLAGWAKNPNPFDVPGLIYTGIIGAARCLAHPALCDLASGIVVDDATDTVTFHLTAPNPEFLDQMSLWGAAAVPADAPNHDVGSHGLPGTGPYRVSAVSPREVTLVRNPYFREWSHAAQPGGYPDRIVWRTGASAEVETTEIERNRADYMYDPPPQNRFNEIETRYTKQLNLFPNDITYALAFNVRRPPFTDVRVRHAINYAVDRAHVASLFGQDSQPTCEAIPPFVLGYAHYCPYTLNPRSGVWSAPDLVRARALIATSGTRGKPITIWTQPIIGINFTPAGRYLVALLRQLGYRARLRVFAASDPRMFEDIADSRTAPGAFMTFAVGGYAMPSQYISGMSCQNFVPDSASNANQVEFCDPQFDALYSRAFAAEGSNPPAAASLWTQADRRLTDDAPFVALVNPDTTDFVSRRVGDYQYNPEFGVLLDQLWVR
jgi:YVTN family beta-propeller protein